MTAPFDDPSSRPVSVATPPPAAAAQPFTPAIRLDGVSLRRDGRVVLEGATLDVKRGGLLVLQGPRGSGKSSLLAAVACALRPAAGALWLAGRNVVDLQASSLPFVRRNVGYLPAAAPLVRADGAVDNVAAALAVRGEPLGFARAHAAAALARVGLAAVGDEPVGRLSAAAQRLVALARAIAGPPPIVVLDDPTQGLDARDRDQVVEALLDTRAAGSAILCASADDAFVDRLAQHGAGKARLDGGRVLTALPSVTLTSLPAVDDALDDDVDLIDEPDARPSPPALPGRAPAWKPLVGLARR